MRDPHNEGLGHNENLPERKCILSGSKGPRDSLIRLAVSPPDADGQITVLPDVHGRAPGRGAWIAPVRQQLEEAMASGRLQGQLRRALRVSGDGRSKDGNRGGEKARDRVQGGNLVIPDNLANMIDAALAKACTERLGLALKAGHLLLGADRIAEQARGGGIVWIGHALDASHDGVRKIEQAWRAGQGAYGDGMAGTILPLDRTTLSVALGRSNVVHMALRDKATAARFAVAFGRLASFRGCVDKPGMHAGRETDLTLKDRGSKSEPVAVD